MVAAESSLVTSTRTVASLVTTTDSVAPGKSFHAALRLRLAPGWHTYWENPGDAGFPPDLRLTLSQNARAGPIEWPLPSRIAEGSLTTYAYTGDVILPVEINPGDGPLAMQAHAEWLACRDVCVPEEADFSLTLPTGSPVPAREAPLIAAAVARTPAPAPFGATVTPGGLLTLTGLAASSDIVAGEFFPLRVGAVEAIARQVPGHEGDRLVLQIDPASGNDTQGVVALTDRHGTVSAYGISPEAIAAPPPPSLPLLLPALLLAAVGGLLLNLMPCVFPVLAMKAMAIARLPEAGIRRLRGEAAAYTAGVLLAFTGLGASLITLRAAGAASGWGFQFQSPVFVTCVAWVLFAVGLNLSGAFEIGAGIMGRGGSLAGRGGYLGSFFTGVLAVVVASPCTAPFMGGAVALALALPASAALALFATMGLGLALPFVSIAFLPRLVGLLPRPGSWMRTLQQLLAFPMYAACVWLVWVVSLQTGSTGVIVAGAGLVALGFAGWALGVAARVSGWARRLARGSALAVVAVIGLLLYATQPGVVAPELAEPFSTARLEQLRNAGRPVFVNMTASWCLSCLVNERVALSDSAVREAFARANVAYLKGDWTNQNPAISAYLHQLGREGVPLYVLYAPGRAPVVLPQLLSEGAVLRELAKLSS